MFLDLILFAVGLFAFILSMIGTLYGFFGKGWRLFVTMLLCVLVISASMVFEIYQFLILAQPQRTPLVSREPYYNPL